MASPKPAKHGNPTACNKTAQTHPNTMQKHPNPHQTKKQKQKTTRNEPLQAEPNETLHNHLHPHLLRQDRRLPSRALCRDRPRAAGAARGARGAAEDGLRSQDGPNRAQDGPRDAKRLITKSLVAESFFEMFLDLPPGHCFDGNWPSALEVLNEIVSRVDSGTTSDDLSHLLMSHSANCTRLGNTYHMHVIASDSGPYHAEPRLA